MMLTGDGMHKGFSGLFVDCPRRADPAIHASQNRLAR